MSVSSISEKQPFEDEKRVHHATAEYREVDEAAQLSTQGEVDPAEARRVRYIACFALIELKLRYP